VAITLTVVDLTRTGQGQQSLGARWLDVSGLGIHLSRADVAVLIAAALGAALTWRGTARGGS
jgi:hypothetical protein